MSLLPQATRHEESGKGWYTRRESVMRGPFSEKNITRYILLGRIRLDDELSQDREHWTIAGHLTSLLPPELASQSSWADYQRLMVAHMETDERKRDRRCQSSKNYLGHNVERRTSPDRRGEEDTTLLDHYLYAEAVSAGRKRLGARHLRPLLLTMLLAALTFTWLYPTHS